MAKDANWCKCSICWMPMIGILAYGARKAHDGACGGSALNVWGDRSKRRSAAPPLASRPWPGPGKRRA